MEINGINRYGVLIIGMNQTKKVLKNNFIVPDYYAKFRCKGGECRHTCCAGWDVTIPMDEYFKIVGLQCNQTLRKTIDRTFRLLDHPTKERYAEIAHNYEGNCPLLLPNGFCQLHAKCKEDALPSVCRYYPRGPRTYFGYESSCSNSCEKTLELLFENENKLTFTEMPLIFKIHHSDKSASKEDQSTFKNIRKYAFDILQKRDIPLSNRILMIGKLFMAIDSFPTVDFDSIDLSIKTYERDIDKSVDVILHISSWLIDNDTSLKAYCEFVRELYENRSIKDVYEPCLNHFEETITNHEILFEKMMMNDLFFRGFPNQEFTMNYYDEFITLCALYLFIRTISIHMMIQYNHIENYIDILSKTFRVIAHTKFGKNMMNQLKCLKLTDFVTLATLIQI